MKALEMQLSLDLEVAYFMDYNAVQIIWDFVTAPERS